MILSRAIRPHEIVWVCTQMRKFFFFFFFLNAYMYNYNSNNNNNDNNHNNNNSNNNSNNDILNSRCDVNKVGE